MQETEKIEPDEDFIHSLLIHDDYYIVNGIPIIADDHEGAIEAYKKLMEKENRDD